MAKTVFGGLGVIGWGYCWTPLLGSGIHRGAIPRTALAAVGVDFPCLLFWSLLETVGPKPKTMAQGCRPRPGTICDTMKVRWGAKAADAGPAISYEHMVRFSPLGWWYECVDREGGEGGGGDLHPTHQPHLPTLGPTFFPPVSYPPRCFSLPAFCRCHPADCRQCFRAAATTGTRG